MHDTDSTSVSDYLSSAVGKALHTATCDRPIQTSRHTPELLCLFLEGPLLHKVECSPGLAADALGRSGRHTRVEERIGLRLCAHTHINTTKQFRIALPC